MSPPAAVPAGAPAPRQSVAARLRQLLILYAVLGLSAITVLLLSFDALSARRELSQQLQSLAQLTAASVSAAVAFRDPYVARDTLTNLALLPQIERACLYLHEQGRTELLADFARPTAPPCPPETTASRGPTRVDKRWAQWTAVTPVVVGQQTVGTLLLGRQLDDLWRVLGWRLLLGATAVGLGLLLALWAARVLQSRTVQPMLDLAQVARKVSESEDFTLRAAEPPQRDEVHALVEDFNAMLQQIESREQALLYTNHRLEDEIIERAQAVESLRAAQQKAQSALEEVQRTQEQLIEAEKMASLGGLVAGVAHEVNNPVGISVTAASQLKDDVETLQGLIASGQLKRSTLEDKLATAGELAAVILSHLQRASELVASFKRVAVDQTADALQDVDLGRYLDEVAVSLQPQMKKSAQELRTELTAGITLHTYPGVLAQVVTNLIINAQHHAFAEGDAGQIRLGLAREADGAVEITVSDNGRGMSAAVRRRIFEPFFTTRRGAGGSGLGLHLVYNLVTHKLGGRIRVTSQPGQGTTFCITLPATDAGPRAEGQQ